MIAVAVVAVTLGLLAAGWVAMGREVRAHQDDVPDGMCGGCWGPWDYEHVAHDRCPTGMLPD